MALLCRPADGGKTDDAGLHLHFGTDGKKHVSCSDASELLIISTIVTGRYTPVELDSAYAEHMAEARARCWERVDAAVLVGHEELTKRHIGSFANAMGETIVRLSGERTDKGLKPCGDDRIASRFECLRSSASGGQKSAPRTASEVAHLTTKGVWFGRYLLLSSTSNAVANLQGIWADGPDSAWSGDYHLNINLQMIYWASDPMGLGRRVLPPLFQWIVAMAKAGEITAQSMYGCPGWVAHGFTDNLLNVGVRGGLEWALCVTCGAWVASHLWDHLTYEFDSSFVWDVMIPIYRSLAQFFLSYMFKDSDGHYHTGPTSSPETSYFFPGKQSNGKPGRSYHQVALSPAIDMSVLRQTANAFAMSLQWLELMLDESVESVDTATLAKDKQLAQSFTAVVQKMINAANPVVSPHTGLILEYPTLASEPRSEGFDSGHRHFSHLHWLYPGTFIPRTGNSSDQVIAAAARTLSAKTSNGGGHTGWSSMWESCLWARLRSGQRVGSAIRRGISKYFTAQGLMGLHPKLGPSDPQGCNTCFHELQNPPQGKRINGMATKNLAVFQLDANMGLVAAVGEMLLQSHEPGVLRVLPALSTELYPSGVVCGMRARGGYEVSMQWTDGKVVGLLLDFQHWHPWLAGQLEISAGYFSSATTHSSFRGSGQAGGNVHLDIVVPNLLTPSTESGGALGECFSIESARMIATHGPEHAFGINIRSFPCSVRLCADGDSCLASKISIYRINRIASTNLV